jgi:phosphoribosyl 1,2-cyclic phosphodiesterase
MMKICALASGSKGNCVLVEGESTKLLIDVGLTARKLESVLMEYNAKVSDIAGCLITHEHIDHVKGAKRISEKYSLPLYAHPSCARLLHSYWDVRAECLAHFDMAGFNVGEFFVEPFGLSHDSVYAVGYRISDGKSVFVYATDCGYCSERFLEMAREADTVLIESNHDIEMLKTGRYPAYLKRRIMSNYGHLSNLACACAVEKLATAGRPRNFILAHISEENNIYELAMSFTKQRLREAGIEGVSLFVARQNEATGFIRCRND